MVRPRRHRQARDESTPERSTSTVVATNLNTPTTRRNVAFSPSRVAFVLRNLAGAKTYSQAMHADSRGRYVEVCAGAGGWGLGLHVAGWTGTGIELDADASETHRRHVGPCLTADVATVATPHGADLVCGGVPCQSFSTAGAQGGLGDPRGRLFRALLRHAVEASARAVALENVRGLVSCGALPVILSAFRAAGFEPVHALLNACDFGVPQNRVRLFIAGFRSADDLARFQWPQPTHGAPDNLYRLPPWRTVREALGLEGVREKGLLPHGNPASPMGMRRIDTETPAPTVRGSSGQDLIGSPLDRPSLTVGIGHGSPYAKSDTRSAVRAALSRIDRPAPTMEHNSGHEGVGPRRASGLLSVDIAAATGDASRSGRLTVRDCARLQSFPDDVEFCGVAAAQFKQVGNAVPPLLGGAIARSLWMALYGDER